MNTSTRSLGLDLLRIFSAFWVVSFHWIGRGGFSPGLDEKLDLSWWPRWFQSFAGPGFLGVDIFFILSGAVIATSAVGKSWQIFAQNRFLRLFPLYLFATITAIALVPMVDSDWKRADALSSISGLQFWIGGPTIIGTAWTLQIEVQFYALVALSIIAWKGLTREKIRALAFGLLALSIVTTHIDLGPVSFIALQPWGGYFALGALLSTCINFVEFKRNLFGILIAMTVSGNMLYNRLSALYPQAGSIYKLLIPVVVVTLVTVIILQATIKTETIPKVRREWLGIATLSLMTYPVYLLHEFTGLSITSLLARQGISEPLALLITAVIIILTSWFGVKVIEPQFKSLLRMLFGWTPQWARPNNR